VFANGDDFETKYEFVQMLYQVFEKSNHVE